MDKTIRRYGSLEAMKSAEYADWARLPPRERMRAVMELTMEFYGLKDVPRLHRTLARIVKRTPR